MARKGLMEGLPKNLPDLEETCPIFILTKETKTSEGLTVDVSKIYPGFILHMDFVCFQCWKHLWIYLDFCGYMLWYFIHLWIYIQKQTYASWHPKIIFTTLSVRVSYSILSNLNSFERISNDIPFVNSPPLFTPTLSFEL